MTKHTAESLQKAVQKSMTKSERIEILSRQLALLYKGDTCGACACMGLECYNLSDFRWWVNFLTLFSKEDIAEMVEVRILYKGYPQAK